MIKLWQGGLLLLAAVLVTGCSQKPQPTPHQYLLMEAADAQPLQQADQLTGLQVAVLPIDLPSYLMSNSMVLVSAQGEVFSSQNNLWAESLAAQLKRLLQRRLNQRLPMVNWYADNNITQYKLRLQLTQFAADTDGWVHVSGLWQLRNPQNKLITQKFFEKRYALDADGYQAMTQALATIWLDEVDHLAAQMTSLAADVPPAKADTP